MSGVPKGKYSCKALILYFGLLLRALDQITLKSCQDACKSTKASNHLCVDCRMLWLVRVKLHQPPSCSEQTNNYSGTCKETMANTKGGGFNFELKKTTSYQTAGHKHVCILSNWRWVQKELERLTELLPMVQLKRPNNVKGKSNGGNTIRGSSYTQLEIRRSKANLGLDYAGITIC